MSSQDLDQLIDAAAEELVGREPSSALTDAVMARVRAPQSSRFRARSSRFSDSRFWLSSGAAVVALAIIVVLNFVLNTPPAPTHAPAPHASVPSQPTHPLIAAAAEPSVGAPIASRPTAKRLMDQSRRSIDDDNVVMTAPADDPLEVNPIAVEPIEIAPIAVAASQPPPPIHIEPLMIEPISSSND